MIKTMNLGKSGLTVPVVAVGCMRISGFSDKEAVEFVQGAYDMGLNFFDHADIYGGGKCEEVFRKASAGIPRDKLILQSKCGIRDGMFDFSEEYILSSVDGILSRLRTDYLDVLLLHRPDALCEPEEVAGAFNKLHTSGKVRHFGVSNHNPMQIELLKRSLNVPIIANQLQLSVTNATMITSGLNVNMQNESATNRDGSVLDYCRLNDITIQTWSPFQYGFFEGTYLGNDNFPELNAKIDELAEKYSVSNTSIVIAWLLRHPAHMQPVTGTTSLSRLRDVTSGTGITLTREEWYAILLAAGNELP